MTCQPCRGQILAVWNRGSAPGRFARALGLAFASALLGAGPYFGIAAFGGYEFGLVAVIVGLLVGGAVRKGSNGRGGWRYQALTIFLTYTAVAATDSSMIAREVSHEMRPKADSAQVAHAGSAPIMIGIATPLHLLIAGFALYEAWKLNKGVALRLTGPYHASAATPGPLS